MVGHNVRPKPKSSAQKDGPRRMNTVSSRIARDHVRDPENSPFGPIGITVQLVQESHMVKFCRLPDDYPDLAHPPAHAARSTPDPAIRSGSWLDRPDQDQGVQAHLRPSGRRALRLTAADATENHLLDAMVAHPILVIRAIVCTPEGVRLCRPSEVVLDLLDRLPPGPLTKEDGQLIIDTKGNRLV
jgi:hypothetical protein